MACGLYKIIPQNSIELIGIPTGNPFERMREDNFSRVPWEGKYHILMVRYAK